MNIRTKEFMYEYIDANRTYSNDIREVKNVLGLEAARQMLFNEITEVMEFADAYINYHHLNLLCDRMCITNDMVPIFRSGLLNDDVGTIAKATFEVHTEVLLNAARHANLDHMRGVSASVLCGQYGNYGTGSFNVILDLEKMKDLNEVVVEKSKTANELFDLHDETNDKCAKNVIEIKNTISNMVANTDEVCEDDDYNMGF